MRFDRAFFLAILLVVTAAGRVCEAGMVPRFAFAVNSFNNTISQFVVDHQSTRLIPNGLAQVSHFPSAIAVHPSNKYVFAVTQTGAMLHVFFLDNATGRLYETPGSPTAIEGASPFAVAVEPGGRYVYVAGRLSHTIEGFEFNVETAELKPIKGMPLATGGEHARHLVVHPNGRFVYSVNVYSDTISAFQIQPDTGVLKPLKDSPYDVGKAPMDMMFSMVEIPDGITQAPYNIQVHPSGEYVFVCNWMSASISVFKVDQATGNLSLVEGSPFRSDPHPYDLAVSPDGRYVYSVHWGMNSIVGFKIDPRGGKLERLRPERFDTFGQAPVDLWFDPTANALFVSHYYSHNIASFRYDPASGALTFQDTTPTRVGPRAFSVSFGTETARFSSNHAFGISAADKSLFAMRIDNQTGELQPAVTVKLDAVPVALAYDKVNALVYVATKEPDQIQAFAMNNNVLKSRVEAPVTLAVTPRSIDVGTNGLLIYLTSAKNNRMLVFERHPETGEIKEWPESPRTTDSYPTQVKIDPVDRFAFVLNEKSNVIGSYRYRGGLWPLINKVEMTRDFGDKNSRFTTINTDPLGNFLYVADSGNDQILVYWINLGTGVLEDPKEFKFKVGDNPRDITFHPSGNWLYVVNAGDATIETFSIEKKSGSLAKKLQTIKTAKLPSRLKLHANGRFAYATFENSKRISVFSVDETTGVLSHKSDVQHDANIADILLDSVIE